MSRNIAFLIMLVSLVGLTSCGDDDGASASGDGFDRQAMLTHWADNIIVPSYEVYVDRLGALVTASETFNNETSLVNLSGLRSAWLDAYQSWQTVSMFEIGKAEELTLRNFTNVFPVNKADMEATIATGSFDLASVNKQDEQGFPALDYLINGLADTDQGIVDTFLEETAESNHGDYLVALSTSLNSLATQVLEDWKNGYRDTFVNNDGSEATSSVNKLVNDLLFYYEKHLRAGKIGIPAGVFSSAPLSDRVEALYSKGSSKILFETALNSFEGFFNGKSVGESVTGESLNTYLNFLNEISGGEDLTTLINNQFASVRTVSAELNDDFEVQVTMDNNKMLATYDELQKNVVYLKVDMLQALSIRVDFVDADGD
ncbi:MAG: imelysin family protein [Cyclobacteriaceae bacterium]